jgi:tripartite-type tricarboxylate transporter receptor subunit TctC
VLARGWRQAVRPADLLPRLLTEPLASKLGQPVIIENKVGAAGNIAAELFKMKTGVRLLHVPYKGDAPAMSDLLGGHVTCMFGNIAAASTHLRTGKLRVLAVTSAKRLESFPDIPTMQELLPGVVAVTWFAIVAPPRTPSAITAKFSSAVIDLLRSSDIIKRYAEVGVTPVGNTQDAMAAWMKEDTERWRTVIKAGAISID